MTNLNVLKFIEKNLYLIAKYINGPIKYFINSRIGIKENSKSSCKQVYASSIDRSTYKKKISFFSVFVECFAVINNNNANKKLK
jgi:hypothetical protein